MLYFPNAKINIGLNILGKREDGYHNFESIFFPVPLKDVLEIIPAKEFSFTVGGVEHIEGENLCVKAYKLLKNDFGLPPINAYLQKIIPIGAGLGGGSADASFMLTALNSFFNLQITNNKLKEYALQLGSDCPFFIDNTPKYVTGRGEVMTDVSLNLKGYFLVLINPNIHISTQEAYSTLKPQENPQKDLIQIIKDYPIEEWKNHIKNDFESNIFKLHPPISEIKNALYKMGALYASMTGTGSTVFGLFNQEVDLKEINESYFKFQAQL